MLELTNIRKSFGERQVLSALNLQLENGNVYTLMGVNGSGKTTLFNIITGFIKADSGTASFKGKNIDSLSPVEINHLGITRTFQNIRLIHELTVKENLLLSFKKNKGENIWNALLPIGVLKKFEADFELTANTIMRKVFLEDVAHSKAGELSYGQQKLLTLGCCLANDGELLLLDEPVSGINTTYQEKIINLIKEIKYTGKTILLIEHNANFIDAVSDRLFFLSEGAVMTFDNYSMLRNNSKVQEAYL